MCSKHERDFLKMAACFLECFDIIYEEIETGVPWPDQLGLLMYEVDTRCEMKLILEEWRHEKEKGEPTIECSTPDRSQETRGQTGGLTL
jgi:hypothetical protein